VCKETQYYVLIDDKLAPELRGPYVGSDAIDDIDSRLYRAQLGADSHEVIAHFANLGAALTEYLLAVKIYGQRHGGNDD
jgi:hypothetical protein